MNELYKEKFTATVNDEQGEGDTHFHEVILKGASSGASLVFRNRRGTRDILPGVTYELVIREVSDKTTKEKNEKVLEEAKPEKAAAPTTVVEDKK